ncbi:MAG: type IV pilus twitching motility protein PilT [Gammaproteobacteria bacterium]|nr:type IV pilus twitching motility protein PilT [Gammaproteobacteria bacterium]
MVIEPILDASVKSRASDIHLVPGIQPLMRVDGVLTPMKDVAALTPEDTKQMVYGLMTPQQQTTFETNLVLEMAIAVPNIGNFRVSAFHQLHGIAAVFRVIPEKVPSFDELGLPPILKSLLTLSYGLILVTGPTGSGKSTTLAAMIDYINSFRSCNIITIEDPIEFVYQNKRSVFNQLQVGRDTTDFASALRASLRQDPNVILIGELRDLETMRLALTAAETGHLVMATLHASSAPIAVNRFVDVFPTEEKNRVRNLLSESLQGVLCQTLVKKATGGRVAAFEVMLSTPPIRNFIRQEMFSHIESAMQTNGDKGMFTLEQYLQDLVNSHIIKDTVADSITANRGAASGSKPR